MPAAGLRRLRGLGVFCLAGAVALGPSVGAGQTGEPSVAPATRRVVHRFDFDERDEGNFETLPMHWRQVVGAGFPRFTEGAFDLEVGHCAPPSFHIESDGRNAAYWYQGPAIAVRPNSSYLVVGYVRPDTLTTARACLSAYYLDQQRLPVAGTQVFGSLIGGDEDQEPWHRVEVQLPPPPPSARFIGLTAWVVQAKVWDQRARPRRHIELPDVTAGAWFDDITVCRVPSVTLATDSAANIFAAPREPILELAVADADAVGMRADLEVRSAAGEVVYASQVPVQTTGSPRSTQLRLVGLEPGLYQAALSIRTGPDTTLTRRLTFAKLAPLVNPGAGAARHFGLALDPWAEIEPRTAQAMLRALGVGAVKVPVWGRTTLPALDAADAGASDELLHGLVNARVFLTGVFAAPPADLVESAGSFAKPLLAILGDDPSGWRAQLTAVVASYSSVFQTWQLGADGDRAVTSDPALATALRNLRAEMVPLLTTVFLSAPGEVGADAGGVTLPAEEVTVFIGRDVHQDWIAAYLQEHLSLDYQRLSAFVENSPGEGYLRLPRLTEFAERIIQTRHAGPATTYVPQLWHSRPTPTGPVTEPAESYLVYRTIIDLLGDRTPGPGVTLAEGVEALAFHDVDTSVLVLWDPEAPPEGRVHDLQLGSARRQIDLWGRVSPLAMTADGGQQVRVFAEPIFIDGVDRWLVDFIAGVQIDPGEAEPSVVPETHLVKLANPGKRQVSGRVLLRAPHGCRVRPREFGFHLPPQSTFEQPVEIRFAHNEPAGAKRLDAVVDFDSEPPWHVEVPLVLQLGIKDVDVWALALLESDRLVLRHGITNRSDRTLSLRSSAAVPGRSRQFRMVASLAPGATTTEEYRFDDADVLSGRTVRLALREVNGPRTHSIELTAP